MAITKSAKKALRQGKRRKVFNDARAHALREGIKHARSAAKSGKDSVENIAQAYQAIDKALKGGLIKKNTAARKKSQIARAFAAKK